MYGGVAAGDGDVDGIALIGPGVISIGWCCGDDGECCIAGGGPYAPCCGYCGLLDVGPRRTLSPAANASRRRRFPRPANPTPIARSA